MPVTQTTFPLQPMQFLRSRALAVLCLACASLAPVAAAPGADIALTSVADDKYEALLDKAIAALAAGNAVEGEKLAFSLAMIDDKRIEGFAALGAAFSMQKKTAEASEAFRAARASAGDVDFRMTALLELVASGAMPPGPGAQGGGTTVVSDPSPPWFEVLQAEADDAIVKDADIRALIATTGIPWKVRDRKTGIVMLLVPPGQFTMGSSEGSSDERVHRVDITKAFYLSETEVSQEVWLAVMSANPSKQQGARFPVESVSWADCREFCKATGFRLPSETEWEYACRAGSTTAFSFGAFITSDQANYDASNPYGTQQFVGEYRRRLVSCGSLPRNLWGFREMHGNVQEWCQDHYELTASSTQQAIDGDGGRLVRGGGWSSIGNVCRSAYRDSAQPNAVYPHVGFRVARAAG